MEYRLIERPTEELQISDDECPIIANSNGTGYYRVAYAPSFLSKLSAIAPNLSEEDHFTLITDCWSTVQLGQADGSALLNLMTNLKGDRSVIVCDAMSRVLSTIDRLEAEKDRNSFRSFARSVLRPVFDSVGWIPQKGESLDTTKLRSDLIWELCILGDEQIQHEGCERFESFLSSPETLDPSLRRSVFSCVGTAGSNEQYKTLKDLAMKSTSAIETENAVKGLAATSDPVRANAVLTWALEGNLAASNAVRLSIWSAQSSVNPEVVWSFLKSHRDEFLRIIPLSVHSMVVDLIAENLSDKHYADEVKEFARTTLSPAARIKFEETEQKILHRSSIKERVIPEINDWIDKNSETAAKH
jgi:hypothetical protein